MAELGLEPGQSDNSVCALLQCGHIVILVVDYKIDLESWQIFFRDVFKDIFFRHPI